MEFEGNILKMRSELPGDKKDKRVVYHLPLGGAEIEINKLIGKSLKIDYSGRINCIHCGRQTKKSFAQGYCYPCFISLPQTDKCILNPEKCEAHLGISRDMTWSEKNCLTDHFVYLALTPGLKVGVTRSSQVPTRWIDQGATEAIILAKTPNRHLAGTIEVELKKNLADKTNWRKMLMGEKGEDIDLAEQKIRVGELLPGPMTQYIYDDNNITSLRYPVDRYPSKVKSLNMDKDPHIEGILAGIKGQYIIFESGEVMNIRKHGGYFISISY